MQEVIDMKDLIGQGLVYHSYIWVILFNIALQYAMTAMMAHLNKPDGPGKAKFKDSGIPTASSEKNIPIVFGTVKFSSPNILWYGGNRTERIRKSGGFLMPSRTVGYRYFLSYVAGLCLSVDNSPVIIRKIFADDKVLRDLDKTVEQINFNSDGDFVGDLDDAINFTVDYQTGNSYINKPRIFGSEGQSNGYTGKFRIYNGTQTTNDSFYASKVTNAPILKDLCYMVFEDNYIGNQNSLPMINFEISHFPIPHWGNTEDAIINFFDYNPVYAFYYILTNPIIGADLDDSMVDIDNFIEVSKVLKAEGFGVSFELSQKTNFDQFKKVFEDTIAATIDMDYSTGKYKIKLNRPDYDPNTIPVLTENEISSLSWDKQTINGTISEYKVSFEDRQNNYKQTSVTASDVGMRFNKNSMSSGSSEYDWIKVSGLASLIAARELKPLSYTLTKAKFNVPKSQLELSRGDVFRLNYGPDNLDLVMRIADIDYGNFDNNNIKISCVEDLFGDFDFQFSPNIPNIPTEDNDAQPASFRVVEMPYYKNKTEKGADVLVAAEKPNSLHTHYDVIRKLSSTTYRVVSTSNFFYTPKIAQPSGGLDSTLYFEDFKGKEDLESRTIEKNRNGENMIIIVDSAGNYEFAVFQNAVLNVGGDKDVNYLTGVKRGLFHGFINITNLDNNPIIIFEDYTERSDMELLDYNNGSTYLSRTKTYTNIQEVRNCFEDFFNHNRELSLTNYTPSNLSVNGNLAPSSIDYPLDYSGTQITKEYGFILENGDQGKDLNAPLDPRLYKNGDFEGDFNEENLCRLYVKDPKNDLTTEVFNGIYRQQRYKMSKHFTDQNYITGYKNQFFPFLSNNQGYHNTALTYSPLENPIKTENKFGVSYGFNYKGNTYHDIYKPSLISGYYDQSNFIYFMPVMRYYYNYISRIDENGNCYIINGYVKMPNTIVKVSEIVNGSRIEYYSDYKTDSHVQTLINDILANIDTHVNTYDSENNIQRQTFLYLDQTETLYSTFTDYFNALLKYTCDLSEPKFIDYDENVVHITNLLDDYNGADVFDINNKFSPEVAGSTTFKEYKELYFISAYYGYINNFFGSDSVELPNDYSHDTYYYKDEFKQKIIETWEEIQKGEPPLDEFFYVNDQPHIVDDFLNSYDIEYFSSYPNNQPSLSSSVSVMNKRKRDFSLLNTYTLTPVDVVSVNWSTDNKNKPTIKFWDEGETQFEDQIAECELKVYAGTNNIANAYLFDDGNFRYDFTIEPDVTQLRFEITDHTKYTPNSEPSEILEWYVNVNRT